MEAGTVHIGCRCVACQDARACTHSKSVCVKGQGGSCCFSRVMLVTARAQATHETWHFACAQV